MNIREQYAYLKPQPVVWVSIFTSACVHLLLIVAFVAGGMYKEKLKPVKQNVMITRLLKKGREKKKISSTT
jgi:hypothetical protein